VPVGRIYEDTSASTSAELRWIWSITVLAEQMGEVAPGRGQTPGGYAAKKWVPILGVSGGEGNAQNTPSLFRAGVQRK
jgi:hypothetical protein